ncbi:MAG: phosphomevalonate kinase [Candidatus Hodarchaeales archaeon]
MISISAPGKLMLSGEWSVLEENVRCIVLAVQQRVYTEIKEAPDYLVELLDFDISTKASFTGKDLILDNSDVKLEFTKYAVQTALLYLSSANITLKRFNLRTRAEINTVQNQKTGEKMKIGFGSSAAAVVAIIGAIMQFHGLVIDSDKIKEIIFKLSIISHYLGQGKVGSGFDVAASTYGGALIYRRFDPEWLQKILLNKSIKEIVDLNWPLLQHESIALPKDLVLMVGYTGTSASTTKLVKQIQVFKQEDPKSYYTLISRIADVTEELIKNIRLNDKEKIINLLDQNRLLLEELSMACSCHLEIRAHQIMSEVASKYGAVAKFSGAGGGDCSIGVCFNPQDAQLVINEWKKNGIMPVDVEFSSTGLRVEFDTLKAN